MTGTDDEVSEESRMIAERLRERASHLPDADGIAGMAATAMAREEMSPDEIRRLADEAITQARQVSYLLGRLAGLLDEPGGAR